MTITMYDLQIVALKVRLQATREQLIKVRDAVNPTGNEDLLSETNKVIDGAWHTLNFDATETSEEFESRLDHQNPYKHGCDPALADNPIGEGMKRTQEIMRDTVGTRTWIDPDTQEIRADPISADEFYKSDDPSSEVIATDGGTAK